MRGSRVVAWLFIFVLVPTVLSTGCSLTPQSSEGPAQTVDSSPPVDPATGLSTKDLDDSKAILLRHLAALSANDTETLLATVLDQSIYLQESWPDQARRWAGLKVISVSYPGKYVTLDAQRSTSRPLAGRTPYQRVRFHVLLDLPAARDWWATQDGMMDTDFTMERGSADGGWLVRDSGR